MGCVMRAILKMGSQCSRYKPKRLLAIYFNLSKLVMLGLLRRILTSLFRMHWTTFIEEERSYNRPSGKELGN